jgi:hypothetical protein
MTTFEKYPLCAPKYSIVRGEWGVPEILFWIGILIFLLLMQDFGILQQTLLRELGMSWRDRREKRTKLNKYCLYHP